MPHNRLTIPTPDNFAFEQTVESHGWYVLPPFRWDAARRILHRTENFDGAGVFDLTIRCRRNLLVESDRDLTPVASELALRMRRMFQLHVDIAPFHELCAKRKSHRRVAEERFGRMLCGSTLFEDAIKIIATTNTAWSQTVRMVTNLVERFGEPSASGSRAVPTATSIAASSGPVLRADCRLGYRADYVHKLSDGIASGAIDTSFASDASIPTDDLFKAFRTFAGIGPYGSAHLLAMEGRHDFIAVDTEFRAFVGATHFRGRDASDREMVAHYERWGRWKYLAYWSELWASLRERVRQAE